MTLRMDVTKKTIGILLILSLLVFAGCGKEKQQVKKETEVQVYTNLTKEPEKEEVKKQMQQAGLSNVDEFFRWTDYYNGSMKDDAGLTGDWTTLDEQAYELNLLAQYYDEANTETGDANSKQTVFLLLADKIEAEDLVDYGTYLMMDMDQIENESQFEAIKPKAFLYSALFDEVPIMTVTDIDGFQKAFLDAWKQRGVVFSEGKASLISVVSEDSFDKVALIAHAGVLIEQDGYLLFIEKRKPTEPYQITRFKDRSALINELLVKRDYSSGDTAFAPILLENDKLLEAK